MASLTKVTVVTWEDADGNRVKPTTPGAIKRRSKSRHWYILYRDEKTPKRVATGCTDKSSASRFMADWLRARERGQVGLSDPYKVHYDRPILDLVAEHHEYVVGHGRCLKHQSEVLRILTAVVQATGYKSIRDVTAGSMSRYLTGMTAGATTKNMHRRIVLSFGNWLEATGCVMHNPIGGKKLRTFKAGAGEAIRERRALTASELEKLFNAAKAYPLLSASVSRGGRPRKDGTPARPSKPAVLTPQTIESKILEGRERWLIYRTAVFTGLRRGELSRLLVKHLTLNNDTPNLNLPGRYTKNGKPAKMLLPAFLATELAAWIAATNKKPDDVVFAVPDTANLTKMHQRLLASAGIPYQDGDGKFADFHSLRYSANVFLRLSGVVDTDRQMFLRHATMAQTERYDDRSGTDRTGILTAFEKMS